MLRRCHWPLHKDFKNYGGRGITVTQHWHTFENFLADMGMRPNGCTLERIDNQKGYYKENCLWATYRAQNFNRRPHKNTTSGIVGVTKVSTGWRAYGKLDGISYELYRGPDKEQAIAARKAWEQKYVKP
jgi:hypothetical protein